MKYCLIYKDSDINILLGKYNTAEEAEGMKYLLGFITNEFPYDSLEVYIENREELI